MIRNPKFFRLSCGNMGRAVSFKGCPNSRCRMTLLDQIVEPLVVDLSGQGWAVCPDFLTGEGLQALIAEVQALWHQGTFRQAGIGRRVGAGVHTGVRGDQICWLDEQALSPAQASYWAAMDALRQTLNRELFLGLVAFEAHYAVYPPETYYRKHLDRFADDDTRMLSCILYLNPHWRIEQGGQLCLYLEDGRTVEVLPQAGTLVLFRSDQLYHEVRPTTQPRYSLTGWFRRRGLRGSL
jgi:SM-20-related protein